MVLPLAPLAFTARLDQALINISRSEVHNSEWALKVSQSGPGASSGFVAEPMRDVWGHWRVAMTVREMGSRST
jgi:hypothetical protein